MPHSIEQGKRFNMLRRILKIVAPDFSAHATEHLEAGVCVLDLKLKRIEVGESTPEIEAVAAVLFQIGHLRLRDRADLAEHFGDIKDIGEKRLIAKLAAQGAKADALAARWAENSFNANFLTEEEDAKALISRYVWNDAAWREYYTPVA